MRTTDVLIVGAGPTGLMAACQLARFGVNCFVIDSKPGPTRESRAIVVTARSLEIYQQMGLSNRVVNDAAVLSGFSVFIDGQEKAGINVGEFGKGLTDFPYLLAFEQSLNEQLLHETLQQQGRSVSWNTEFLSLKQNESNVIAEILNHDGTTELIEAKYLLACDGARSKIRHQLNIPFRGGTYENKFFVADAEVDWELPHEKLILFPSVKSFCGFFPMRGHNLYRVIGSLPREFYNREDITFQDLENQVKEAVQLPLQFRKVNWFSLYKLHHRCVDQFRVGNCFLAGDAAHIHSPAGGQGMNTGLQDAYNLAWKLAMVIEKRASPGLLNTYEPERMPFAKWLMKFTDRGFSIMTSTNPVMNILRKYFISVFMRFIFKNRSFRKKAFITLSQFWYNYRKNRLSKHYSVQNLTFRAGDRLPYINKPQPLYPLLTEPAFHLLLVNNAIPLTIPSEWRDRVKQLPVASSNEWAEMGVIKPLYLLLRPDNYIALIADELNEYSLGEYFNSF